MKPKKYLRLFLQTLLVMLVLGMLYGTSDAFTSPVHVSFNLEGCRNDGTITLPNGSGQFVCSDSFYTSGNLGKGWNELDLVPHRLITNAGTQNTATTDYNVIIAADYQTSGKTGYDLISVPVINTSESDASCTITAGDLLTEGSATNPFGGGTDVIYYRVLTIHQAKGTTCVFDYYERLALGAIQYPGSSLQSYMFQSNDFNTGKQTISIPVHEAKPQSISKDETATEGADYAWEIVKSPTPAVLTFADTCTKPDDSQGVQITVSWTKKAATYGVINVTAHIYATNPSARGITIDVTDTIYAGTTQTTALDTATSGPVTVPANTANLLVLTHTLELDPGSQTSLNDVATATYTDTVTGTPIPGTTTATASSTVQVTTTNASATVNDVESITTGAGLGYSADSFTPAIGAFDGSYVAGTETTGSVSWTSNSQADSGSVTFGKTVYVTGPSTEDGTLNDTATLTGSDGFTTSANASVDISVDAKVTLTINKTIPDVLEGDETASFTFKVCKDNGSGGCDGSDVGSTTITFSAGQTGPKAGTVSGLTPGVTYRVYEDPIPTGWDAVSAQTVTISLPSCSGSVDFSNTTGVQNPATASVKKITVPPGNEAGWTFMLSSSGPGTNCNVNKTVATTGADAVDFGVNLKDNCTYTITETSQNNWDLTNILPPSGGSGSIGDKTCTFSVDLPGDAGQTFECDFTNTRIGKDLTVSKTATSSFKRTFDWTIEKSADKKTVYSAGGGESEPANFTVTVTKNAGTGSDFAVSGKITVHNPNDFAVNGVSLSDSAPDGTCTVTPATVDVAAGGDATADYVCTFASNPGSGTNTATATWPDINSPNTIGTGTANYTFSTPTTVINDAIDVTDTNGGSWHFTASGSVSYSKTYTDPAGTCTSHENTATITQLGKSASATVTDCQGADLVVTKKAAGTFDRLYKWLIDKSVDQTKINIAEGGTATFNYSVKVTPDGYTDSGWTLSGKITLQNPNDWQAITLSSLADAVDNGGTCTVDPGPYVVPASGTLDVNYSCSYSSAPSSYGGTNASTATWDNATYHTLNGSASGSAAFTLAQSGSTDKVITVVDDKTDPYNPAILGTCNWDDGERTFTYSLDKQGTAGKCIDYTNIAVIDETKQSDSQTVTLCVGKDLTVSKTAAGTFDRLYLWKITKEVDKTSVIIDQGGSYTFHYTVNVEETGLSDSGWKVYGTITLTNPNDWEAITLTSLTDAVDNDGTCTVQSGPYVVPASGTLGVTYNCTYSSTPSSYSGTNTATATWDSATYFTPSGSATGSTSFTEDQSGSTNKTVHVTDDYGGDLGTVTATDSTPFTTAAFTYTRTVSSGDVPGPECSKFDNTATITETDQTASQSVNVCVYGEAKVVKTVSGQRPAAGQTFTFQLRKDATTSSDGTTLEQVNTDASGNITFTTNLVPGQTYQICEWVMPGWNTNLSGDGALFVPNSIIPPSLPNPNVNNMTVCADFTMTSGQSRTFTVDNTPPPGGRALTIGFWKNWASCSSSQGKGQKPMLDLALAYASQTTTNPPGGLVVSAQNAGSGWPNYASLWYLILKGDATSTEKNIKPAPDCSKAVNLLNKSTSDGKKKMASDPLFNMAAQLVGAELNRFMGAGISGITITNINRGVLLLGKYKFDGLTYSPKLSKGDTNLANCLATQLDNYNNDRPVSSCP